METPWIIDHAQINDKQRYIVFAIASRNDKSTYLSHACNMAGWQFKQCFEGAYAALPMPEWNGLPVPPTPSESE